jgi:putative transposase
VGRSLRDSTELEAILQVLIREHPTYGYRRLWALLRNRLGIRANRKKIYRILKAKRWLVHQRPVTPRPRVKASVSRTTHSDRRWAMDMTHVDCGRDGWAHLVGVIDCHDRELLGWEFALRGRAKEAERAIEEACIARFGTLRPAGQTPVVRSDNGLIFQSRRFRAACRDYRLSQEFITPYTPEQNGIIERFFRSLKEECVWQHSFHSFAEAKAAVRQWIEWYNTGRPHQSLGYLSPREFRAQQQLSVATMIRVKPPVDGHVFRFRSYIPPTSFCTALSQSSSTAA